MLSKTEMSEVILHTPGYRFVAQSTDDYVFYVLYVVLFAMIVVVCVCVVDVVFGMLVCFFRLLHV